MADENPTKRCCLCHWYLPLTCFHKGQYPDGLRPDCKDCRKIATRADYVKRKPKLAEYQRDYRSKHSKQISDYLREWRRRNHESLKITKAAYYKRPEIAARSVER